MLSTKRVRPVYSKVGIGSGTVIGKGKFEGVTVDLEQFQEVDYALTNRAFRIHKTPQVDIMLRNKSYVATGDRSFKLLEELSDCIRFSRGWHRDFFLTLYSAAKRQIYSEGRIVVQLV